MEQPVVAAPVPTVLPAHLQRRLAAREAERQARRDVHGDTATDGTEDAVAYYQIFEGQRASLEAALAELGSRRISTGQEGDQEQLQKIEQKIKQLNQEVVRASSYLPYHDQASYQAALLSLRQSLEAARGASKPAGKFSFTKRASSKAPLHSTISGTAVDAELPANPTEHPATPNSRGSPQEATQPPCASAGSGPAAAETRTEESSTTGAHQQRTGFICCLQDKEITREAEQLAGQDILLQDLRNCTVRLHGSLGSLRIDRVTGCTIHAGPVQGAAFVQEVRDSTLVLAAHQGHTDDNQKWREVLDFGWIKASPSPNWSTLLENEFLQSYDHTNEANLRSLQKLSCSE
ncbi:hypothetical protein WJX84_010780 [Apatococcus fuscideae]|uniref:C-CAP/cofactor C-like domain-containing protein n=1 Tax=Apatococcus fuscideae TaxID=2026836 RepID=A0AAW1TDI7_9CHLO